MKLVIWWNCAGGLNGKINEIKKLIKDESPLALFISESNTKENKTVLHLNITGYQFLTTISPFSRVACYLRNDIHMVPVVCRGDRNEVITLDFDRSVPAV